MQDELIKEEQKLTKILFPELSNYFGKFKKNACDVKKNADPDAVHDLRVSIRRLKSLVYIFEEMTDGLKLKPFKKEMKIVMKPFGRLRDMHVQEELVKKSMQNKTNHNFLSPFFHQLDVKIQKEEDAQEDHIRKFSFDHTEKLISGILSRKSITLPRKKKYTKIAERGLSYPVTRYVLQESLMKCFAYFPIVKNPRCEHEYHRLRVNIKKMRYKLEILGELVQKEMPPEGIELFKKIQDDMGDAHDIDVACSDVNHFFQEYDPEVFHTKEYNSWYKSIRTQRETLYRSSLQELEKLKMMNFHTGGLESPEQQKNAAE